MPTLEISGLRGHDAKDETKKLISKLRSDRKAWVGALAILTIVLFYTSGVIIASQPLPWAFFGVPMMAESMILSWYLGHECAHSLVFRNRRLNNLLGEALGCLNGGAYFAFQGFSADHMRHHSEQIDFADIENSQLFGMLPRYVQLGIFRLELIYLPAAYLLIKGYGLAAGIRSGGVPAVRIMIVLCAYLLFYCVLFLVSPMALLLFFVAVVLRIHCVRFVDAFQHTYEQVSPDGPKRPKDKVYEQRNTFSFPVARRWKPLNLLIMNFGFHNAHHAVMTCPWYNLSKLDEVLFSATQSGTSPAGHAYDRHDVSFWELLHRYHLDRISRITADNAGTAYDAEAEMAFSMRNFRGALTDNLLG